MAMLKCRDKNSKFLGNGKVGKSNLMVSRFKLSWRIKWGMMAIFLWTCVLRLIAMDEVWGPRLLKGWPSCYTPDMFSKANMSYVQPKVPPPPKRVYKNNGYLMVSCNGGLNQMRAAICDMVAIARYLNVTLIVPELDKKSFWADTSEFNDIFDVDHFITSLRDEVRILKELPTRLKKRVEVGRFYSMPPVSWSNISYYSYKILPLIQKYKVVHFNKSDARLANNGLPIETQKLRCKVNYSALRFTSQIEELGRKVVRILKQNGPFLVLHLRYEMDMLAFSGCTQGCNIVEVEELTTMRYAYPWWKEKVIDSDLKRKEGLCPLTPEETALVLRGLGIDHKIQIYIAAGELYGGERRMASLAAAFPNLVRKETLLEPSDLRFCQNHSSQMAAVDYFVSLESDIFVPTYNGNMAKVVEGHRRYYVVTNTIASTPAAMPLLKWPWGSIWHLLFLQLGILFIFLIFSPFDLFVPSKIVLACLNFSRFLGFKKTIQLQRKLLVDAIDQYHDGLLSWDEFSSIVKEAHANRIGSPRNRVVISGRPKEEDSFHANPHECLQPLDEPLRII
ncbi:unnamed protein product [Ilex paraguariensis]|uniref:O-fucosyltransferase family protein n=1 Tax=Ilex paraguariensis TaxID=185542 RepID=A0ABC8QNW5_9AQUA